MGVERVCPRYLRLRFLFAASPGVSLPEYPGSAWRGAFGRALRESVCIVGQADCRGCLLADRCHYSYLFETPAGQLPNGNAATHAPHPLVLELLPPSASSGAPFVLGITLIGRAADSARLVAFAAARAGTRGIAGRDNRFELQAAEWHDGDGWRALPPSGSVPAPRAALPEMPSGPIRIEFTSLLRLKHHNRFAGVADLSPRLLLFALYHRFSQLSLLHDGGDAPPEPWPLPPAEQAFLDAGLRWIELDRYSSRQGRKHPIGGLLGHVSLDPSGLKDAWPLLWHGQFLHIGKLTSLGHGGYRVGGGKLAVDYEQGSWSYLSPAGQAAVVTTYEGTAS